MAVIKKKMGMRLRAMSEGTTTTTTTITTVTARCQSPHSPETEDTTRQKMKNILTVHQAEWRSRHSVLSVNCHLVKITILMTTTGVQSAPFQGEPFARNLVK